MAVAAVQRVSAFLHCKDGGFRIRRPLSLKKEKVDFNLTLGRRCVKIKIVPSQLLRRIYSRR